MPGGVGKPSAVLVDFDDTLLDNSVVPESVERTCRELGQLLHGLDAEQLLAENTRIFASYWPEVEPRCWVGELEMSDVSHEVWRRALIACGVVDPTSVALAFETHQRIGREMTCVFSDVAGFLAGVRSSGVPLVLVSNSSPLSQLAKIADAGLKGAFDAVVISGAVGVAKPDAEIFSIALSKVDADPGSAWHVGDSLSTDVRGASVSGLSSIWLNRSGRGRTTSDPLPTLEVRNLEEALSALLG